MNFCGQRNDYKPWFVDGHGLNVQRSGFALIAGLALMGLILMTVLSLSVITRVEIVTTQQSKALTLARENARLGLFIALGELQKHAGPDQRVTARAEIYNSSLTGGTRYWTGVWDSADTSVPSVWLVSGFAPDPSSALSGDYVVRLVGESSVGTAASNPDASNQVIDVESMEAGNGGRYAWWVGDEGVKANICQVGNRPMYPTVDGASSLTERRELSVNLAQSGVRVGTEALVGTEFADTGTFHQTDLPAKRELSTLSHQTDLAHIANIAENFSPQHFHDLTTVSSGLLVDTASGGMRMNLDSPVAGDPADPFTNGDLDAYMDYARNHTTFETRRYGTTYGLDAESQLAANWQSDRPEQPATGYRAYHHLTPIMTEFAIYFSVFHRPYDGGHPGLRYEMELELYNPYSFPLLLSRSDRRSLSVMVEGLPEIRVTRNSAYGRFISTSGWVAIDDLPQHGGAVETSSWLEINDESLGVTPDEQDSVSYLMPGEVYMINEPNRSGGLIKYMKGKQPHDVDENDEIVVECRAPDGSDTGKFSVKLVKGFKSFDEGVDTRLPGDPPIFEIKNIPYEGNPDRFFYVFDRAGPRAGRHNPQSKRYYIQGDGKQADVDVGNTYIFAFHYRLGAGAGHGELLQYHDLRVPSIDYEGSFSYVDEHGQKVEKNYSDFIETADFNPISINASIGGAFDDNDDAFWDLRLRHRDPDATDSERYADIRLYDIPTQMPNSIAGLRHAYFVGTAPLSLTSPYGGEINGAFDKYFFSTVPRPTGSGKDWDAKSSVLLPNPYMRVRNTSQSLANLRSATSAPYFRVDAAFNVNSTSVKAWRAVLDQGTIDQSVAEQDRIPLFIKTEPSNGLPVPFDMENYFFRFPFGGLEYTKALGDSSILSGEDGLLSLSQTAFQRESTSQGFRSLNSVEGDDQIHQLAYHIVENIKARGEPFGSLEGFINSGVVEDAIEEVGSAVDGFSIPAVTPINKDLKPYAPTYLKQTDIIASLATHMSARSDTFRIRAYGDYRNSITAEVEATARLEAIVQRVPEIIGDGTSQIDPMLNATETNRGRAFKIVSMRWIDE